MAEAGGSHSAVARAQPGAMWGIVLLIFFVAGSREISITEFSVPDAVESGQDVLLQCGYDLDSTESGQGLTVKWWFKPLNEPDEERNQLYQRIAGQPSEKTKTDIEIKGNDDILLRNVTPEDSGTYECEVSTIEDEKRQHDNLVVYTKGDLALNITEVEDGPDEDDENDVLITCEATDVAPYPYLEISVNGKILPGNDTVISQDNDTFAVYYTTSLSRDLADGADISCELLYKNANIIHEPYKLTQTFYADLSALTTTEDFDEASTTEATPDNRDACVGPASSLLLVTSAIFLPILLNTK